MLCARAARTAVRSRGLALMSPPPRRAATVISLISLVKIFPRLASLAAFLCLIVLHLEWPDIERPRRLPAVVASYHMPPAGTTANGSRRLDMGSLARNAFPRYGSAQCGGDGWRCWFWERSSPPGAPLRGGRE